MSIIIRDLSYVHSDKEVLFQHLNLVINPGDKIALTGNYGLLQVIYLLQPERSATRNISIMCLNISGNMMTGPLHRL